MGNYVPMHPATGTGPEAISLLTLSSGDMDMYEGQDTHVKSRDTGTKYQHELIKCKTDLPEQRVTESVLPSLTCRFL